MTGSQRSGGRGRAAGRVTKVHQTHRTGKKVEKEWDIQAEHHRKWNWGQKA